MRIAIFTSVVSIAFAASAAHASIFEDRSQAAAASQAAENQRLFMQDIAERNERRISFIQKIGLDHGGVLITSTHYCREDICGHEGEIDGIDFTTGDDYACRYHSGNVVAECYDAQNRSVDLRPKISKVSKVSKHRKTR